MTWGRAGSALSGVSVLGGPGCHGRIDRADDPALPPAVLVTVHDDAPPAVVREVCAGAEEQGIPTAILAPTFLAWTSRAMAASPRTMRT